MKFGVRLKLMLATWTLGYALAHGASLTTQPTNAPPAASARKMFTVDLPTVLRLAHAQNLDIQIARARLAEARAAHEAANFRFLPSLSPGITYGRHEGNLQQSSGVISDVDKQFYAPGAGIVAQVPLGEAIYASLVARQLVQAAHQAAKAQEQDSGLAAAQHYFELTKAQSQVGVAREAVRISQNYQDQLHRAVGLGIAFQGDEYRIRVQTDHYQQALRQASERARVTGARLAEVLNLDATVELMAVDEEPVAITLYQATVAAENLVNQALILRPELKQSQAVVTAAKKTRAGVVYGPLVPSPGVQAFAGGLGGGIEGDTGHLGASYDAVAFLGWRIGPGGLFDSSRKHAAEARLQAARLGDEKLKAQIVREVVESHARVQSLADQLVTTHQALTNAVETLRLTQQRKEFAVGDVLENILSQQELTRARNDHVEVVAEYNKAQYGLRRAVGSFSLPTASR